MPTIKTIIARWGLALLWMAVIFASSATPSYHLPRFGALDFIVKKGGHMLAYALLALLYRRGLGGGARRGVWAWVLAVAYALLDEFHQSFVPGRQPSLVDALLFDGGGAAAALTITWLISRKKA
jgi:VanZ family protein